MVKAAAAAVGAAMMRTVRVGRKFGEHNGLGEANRLHNVVALLYFGRDGRRTHGVKHEFRTHGDAGARLNRSWREV